MATTYHYVLTQTWPKSYLPLCLERFRDILEVLKVFVLKLIRLACLGSAGSHGLGGGVYNTRMNSTQAEVREKEE